MTENPLHSSVSAVLSTMGNRGSASLNEIWTRYFPKLVNLAHMTLNHLPHRAEDAHDAAQSAMLSFWQRLDKGGIEATLDRNSLWGLLATITARKAQQIVRKEFARKRGGGVVAPFTDVLDADTGLRVSELLTYLPSDDFDLACEERLQELPEDLRPFAMLRLFSHTNVEVSEILGCSQRKVERKLNLIRSYWCASE